MANSIKVITGMIAKRSLAVLHSKLLFPGWINRQYNDEYARKGAKIGNTLRVRKPARVITTGGTRNTGDKMTLSTQAFNEGEIPLKLNMWRGAMFEFTSAELTLDMDDLEMRFIEPVMKQVASDVESDMIVAVAPYIANAVIGEGTTSAKLLDVLKVRAKLGAFDAPEGDRYLMLSPLDEPALVNEAQVRFNPAKELSDSFAEGTLGEANGFVWGVSNRLPTITLPADIAGVTVSTNYVAGATTILLAGLTDGQVIPAGAVITFANSYAMQPETRKNLGFLKQISVVADKTVGADGDATGTATVTINEVMYATGAEQNVSALPVATNGVVFLGTASKTYRQIIAFHRDAFTMATADLALPSGGAVGSNASMDNLSARVLVGFDMADSEDIKRFDILFLAAALRPEWSSKILIEQ